MRRALFSSRSISFVHKQNAHRCSFTIDYNGGYGNNNGGGYNNGGGRNGNGPRGGMGKGTSSTPLLSTNTHTSQYNTHTHRTNFASRILLGFLIRFLFLSACTQNVKHLKLSARKMCIILATNQQKPQTTQSHTLTDLYIHTHTPS